MRVPVLCLAGQVLRNRILHFDKFFYFVYRENESFFARLSELPCPITKTSQSELLWKFFYLVLISQSY
jgi:hypothetical protein